MSPRWTKRELEGLEEQNGDRDRSNSFTSRRRDLIGPAQRMSPSPIEEEGAQSESLGIKGPVKGNPIETTPTWSSMGMGDY